jgi:flagellar basal body-associated protein FliL
MSDEQPVAAPAAGSKKPMLIVGALALLLGGGGGYAASAVFGSGSASTSEEASSSEGAAAAEEGAHGEGDPAVEGEGAAEGQANTELKTDPNGAAVIALGSPFTINLRGSGGGRVLRMDIQIEALGKDAGVITAKVPAIRDTILIATSDYSWSELEGTDGKTRLRDELLARVNGVTTPLNVNKLYFTQFVVQ